MYLAHFCILLMTQHYDNSRILQDSNRKVEYKVIQHNANCAQPENLLIAMIHDDSPLVRELGYRRILKARSAVQKETKSFAVPKINFTASEYHLMIDWQTTNVTEPPSTKYLTNTEVETLIKRREKPKNMTNFPCHTQAVERMIKLVTDASAAVVGQESRDGYIRARIEGKKKRLPKFEYKSHYQPL